MKKIIIFYMFLGFSSFSVMAATVQCPKPESITSTTVEKDSDGISGMVYCSPSAADCQWKGSDPMAEKGSKVKESLNSDRQPTEHNGLTYCDYKLASGDQIRMSLTK
ncbi:hypothetical protein ACGVWS_08575 [Enterobacteriaceae bacterium LUAb1]